MWLATPHPFVGWGCHLKTHQVLQDPWWVLPVEVVHGLTFAAMWAATTDYAHGVAPGAVSVWWRSEEENMFAGNKL